VPAYRSLFTGRGAVRHDRKTPQALPESPARPGLQQQCGLHWTRKKVCPNASFLFSLIRMKGNPMDLRLQLLDSFVAKGSDGRDYKVRAYDRLVALPAKPGQWEPSGEAEYRLEDGRAVEVRKDGSMRIAGSDITLASLENSR
jgi:hypothetical protein